MSRFAPVSLLCLVLTACGGRNSPPTVAVEGDKKSAHLRTLEAGGELLQDKSPLAGIHMYLNAFHWYAGDMGRQVEAHHYCTHLSDDFAQCVVYDGNGPDARLIGVEYIVSEEVFKGLPDEEKKLWHGHQYESRSGQIIAPGVPDPAEKEIMKRLERTYGKTWHFWQVDRQDKLPLGIPQLMMGFTAPGQINEDLIADRDRRFKTDSKKNQAYFSDIPQLPTVPGANSWLEGEVVQLNLERLQGVKNSPTAVPDRKTGTAPPSDQRGNTRGQ
jgi:hypothetical protein